MFEYFSCDIGVNQGEQISPSLFAIHLNDLEDYLMQSQVECLKDTNYLSMEHLNTNTDMQHSSRGKFDCSFKTEFILENYLLRLKPANRKTLCRLRTSNLHLPIEKGT